MGLRGPQRPQNDQPHVIRSGGPGQPGYTWDGPEIAAPPEKTEPDAE